VTPDPRRLKRALDDLYRQYDRADALADRSKSSVVTGTRPTAK